MRCWRRNDLSASCISFSLTMLPLTSEDWQRLQQVAATGQVAERALIECLVIAEAADEARCQALISGGDLKDVIEQRLVWLQRCYGDVVAWASPKGIADPLLLLWQLWLPLAQQLIEQRQRLGRPLIQGLLGMQGAGKTTLGEVLTLLLEWMGYRTLSWSIDDLYKTYGDRQLLQQDDPRLIWRGPPGTHDVDLGIAALELLRQGRAAEIPQFDKALQGGQGDRIASRSVQGIEIVIFEGWFLGAQPVEPERFEAGAQETEPLPEPLPEPIVTEADRAFARDCNERLGEYLPLWELCDRLMVLSLTDYRLSKRWRLAAEQRLRAEGRGGMTDAEVGAFVDYFWKALHPALFVQPLVQSGGSGGRTADWVVEVGEGHRLERVYAPTLKQPPR